MKSAVIRVLAFAALAVQPAFAQIQFGGKFDHNRYLQYEPVTVNLTVVNKTAKTLILGEVGGETRIRFDVRDTAGHYIQPRPGARAISMLVGAGQTVTTNVNVRDYCRLDSVGSFTVTPMLVTPSRTYLAPKTFLDIVSGAVVSEMVLDVDGGLRSYSLRSCARDRRTDLFLRIDDRENGMCYGVHLLGNVLSFQKPRMEVDEDDRLHIVHQAHPSYLTHHVFSLNGSLIRRASYRRDGTDDLLDDEDHMELMAGEAVMDPPPAVSVPAPGPAASEPSLLEVWEAAASAPDPVRASEVSEVDAIIQDLEAAPAPVIPAPKASVPAAPPPAVSIPEPAPAPLDPLQAPVPL